MSETPTLCAECNRPKSEHTGYEQSTPGISGCAGFCPGPFCPECQGEHCKRHGFDPCECDVVDRHYVPAARDI